MPPASGADVDVAVSADRGPHGAKAPVETDRRLYGMNIADWRPQDYTPPSPAYVSYLKALSPGVLRWPSGHRSQHYVWSRGGGGQGGDWTLSAASIDTFMAFASSMGAKPLFAINAKTGTPAAARDLVSYLNVEKKYGIEWFQIGNEPDYTDGLTSTPEAAAAQLAAYVDAIHEVDPKARIVAPEIMTGAHIGGLHNKVDWMGRILAVAGDRVDGISWHYYPLDSGQTNPTSSAIMSVEHLFQESASDWAPAGLGYVDMVMPALAALRDAHAPGAETWITEFAEDPGPGAGEGISDKVAGALWAADALGRYAEYRPGGIVKFLFKSGPEHKYTLLTADETPRPAYGAYWLYARAMGNRWVETTSTKLTEVAAHAALRSDGALTVVLVNKTTAQKTVHVATSGFCAAGAGEITLEGSGYDASEFTVDGKAMTPALAEGPLDPKPLAAPFTITVPPTSIKVVVYNPA